MEPLYRTCELVQPRSIGPIFLGICPSPRWPCHPLIIHMADYRRRVIHAGVKRTLSPLAVGYGIFGTDWHWDYPIFTGDPLPPPTLGWKYSSPRCRRIERSDVIGPPTESRHADSTRNHFCSKFCRCGIFSPDRVNLDYNNTGQPNGRKYCHVHRGRNWRLCIFLLCSQKNTHQPGGHLLLYRGLFYDYDRHHFS